ncbi:hypothetical protein HanHA300_Chr09g0340621 [Helianthus annuus]|nr:hypothetical protein HanHA300_Chr09g0340621 [Helianthus annuus]KAJ0536876.1 hypothetical protein HanIR_Chr09g0446561 [Helianthus annuus]KAJ0544458.1 hypothetical protein HanHA89_Chr09g0361901 [Helianthus annuus]KAJ0709461.1 hypothetical protein HanLR1_Chr09g0340641 [Helianthus annuus]
MRPLPSFSLLIVFPTFTYTRGDIIIYFLLPPIKIFVGGHPSSGHKTCHLCVNLPMWPHITLPWSLCTGGFSFLLFFLHLHIFFLHGWCPRSTDLILVPQLIGHDILISRELDLYLPIFLHVSHVKFLHWLRDP